MGYQEHGCFEAANNLHFVANDGKIYALARNTPGDLGFVVIPTRRDKSIRFELVMTSDEYNESEFSF